MSNNVEGDISSAGNQEIDYITNIQPTIMLGMYERNFLIEDALELPVYELDSQEMRIHDVVWGDCEIGSQPYDQLLLRLARTPLFRRLQSIEQLTLGPDYATMPNTTHFSRWQHVWGSLAFVRKMTEGDERFNERQKMVLQLRTLLSDVGHTAFSHLGDWLFQGLNGGEDLHDHDLKELLEATGTADLLREYEFSVEETIFPELEDWVESPRPYLCVDRVDYGMREILRWGVPTIPLLRHKQLLQDPQKMFIIDEQMRLVFRDVVMAQYFAAGFSLLPTEHWGHPVHRLQLELLQTAVRGALLDKAQLAHHHPRDLMYGIDVDFESYFQTWEALFLNHTMRDIALWQRRIFQQARRADLNQVFGGIEQLEHGESWDFPAFPEPLTPYSWQSRKYSRPYPPHLEIEEVDNITEVTMRAGDNGLQIDLPPLKARAVDPPVLHNGIVRSLSEIVPSYGTYLANQRSVMAKGYRATLLLRQDIAAKAVKERQLLHDQWPELLQYPRNTDLLKDIIDKSMVMAAGHRFDKIYEY